MTFQNSDFMVDSDAAFQTAAAKGADWIKAHPDKQWSMELGAAARFPAPVWLVMWGQAKSEAFVAYVNAATGDLITK
jgi:hypothetical protein